MYTCRYLKMKLFRIISRRYSSVISSEYTQTPQYPAIFDTSPKETLKRNKINKYEKNKKLHTVEEKLFALNLDKYYGWNCLILREHIFPYQFLPFVKYITRTFVVEGNKDLFQKVLNVNDNECKLNAENLRKHLQEAILFELKGRRLIQDNELNLNAKESPSNRVIEAINSVILSYLSSQYPHLLQTMVDYRPRLEAFWMVGSFHPSDTLQQERKDKKCDEEELSELVDHWIQYYGAPVIQLRNQLPLVPLETQHLTEYNDSKNLSEISLENHDPQLSFGVPFERRHGTTIPGFWPGDEHEFGILSYHNRGTLQDRPPHFGEKEHNDTVIAQAVLASYAWLHGQASYQGFSTFADVTYPLITQNVISDGRLFNYTLYQLNTTLLHSENSMTNSRVNVCVTMPNSPLYQEIRGSEFIGWNDEVVSTLLSFYLNEPKSREGVDLKPYLHPEERYLADITENDRRIWLHKQFRHMYSKRPRHLLTYEIYDWERIYKIKFPTRPFEARMRPFERDENPIEDRKYNDHMPPYVPKKFLPKKKHWTGWRGKFAKTFYPDV